MATQQKRLDRNSAQLNLFDHLRAQQAAEAEKKKMIEGTLNVSDPLRVSLNEAIKKCALSRHQIAGEMSHMIGREVTKTQLDSWTAESKELNRIPAEYLPAFCRTTGSQEPIRIITEAAGAFSMPGPDALRSEIQRLSEQEKKIRSEKRKREIFLLEMEGKK